MSATPNHGRQRGATVPRLDRGSALPLHVQAEGALRELIGQQPYLGGGHLPDEVSLSRQLGISRNTLRAAIARLVAEGRLERRAGVGTRVVEPRVSSGIGAWHSFTREMAANGITVTTFASKAALVSAPLAVAGALRVQPGTTVLRLDRLRGWDGAPEVHFRSYLHPRLGLGVTSDFSRPLYELIADVCHVIADQSLERLRAVGADRRLAGLLCVQPGTALLRRERTVLDAARKPIEFALVHYRCERFSLTLNLRHA